MSGRQIVFVVHPCGVREATDENLFRTHRGEPQRLVQFAGQLKPSWVNRCQVASDRETARARYRAAIKHRDDVRLDGRDIGIVAACIELYGVGEVAA